MEIYQNYFEFANLTINAENGVSKTCIIPAPVGGADTYNHICCWCTGVMGLIASFDMFSTTSTVYVYILNTTNYSITTNNNFRIHIISLFGITRR